MNNMKKPKIRFKGFTDDWEQRKLGEMGQTYTGLSGKAKDDFGHGQARFVTYMNVFSNPISNPEMTEPIEIDPKQNEVEVGDVFFTTSSETPEEVGMSSILLEKRGKTYLNSFCFGFRPSEKIDSYYLAYMLRSESTRAKIILLAQGISRYNISKNKVMEIAVSLPSLDEQKMIGQYFSQLDNLITLHQRKYEKLQIIKKSMLENCFPKNGEKVPKIRFSGFTGDWEQRKVGEVIEDYVEKTTVQNQYPVLTSSQQQGIVLQEDYFADRQVTTNDNVGYYVLPRGYFTYRSRSDTDLFVFNRNNLIDKGIISYYYPVFRPKNVDSNFLLRRLNNGIRSQVSMAAEGTGQHVLAHSKLKNMEFLVPSVPEQKLIGAYFEILDHLITLHQSELEKLQKIKKSLLERMFV